MNSAWILVLCRVQLQEKLYSGDRIFERISTEDNDWTFYRTEGKQIVSVFSNLIKGYFLT